MKRLVYLALAISAAGCSDAAGPVITALDFDVVTDALFPGDTTRLVPVIQIEGGSYVVEPSVEWSTSDSTIVRVAETGHAIAVRSGRAQLTMRYGSMTKMRDVTVEEGFVSIEAGPAATCGELKSGAIYCWGDGRSYFNSSQSPHPHARRVPTNLRFTQFSVGSNHTCGVTAAGAAYCWGLASTGAGGNGVWLGSAEPREVAAGLQIKEISAAWEHTCALSMDGVAYCWGRNREGQLGIGSFDFKLAPVTVNTEHRFTQLQAAGSNSCGLTVNKETYCWGHRGYLGDSTITQNQTAPTRVPVPPIDVFDSANDDPCGITPAKELYCWTNSVQKISAAGQVTEVTVGGTHVCIKRTDATLLCYGKNNYGQLGTGNNNDSSDPIAPAGNLKFIQISAGGTHTCGVTDTGAAYCWGNNDFGQLGDGSRASSNVPVRVLMTRE